MFKNTIISILAAVLVVEHTSVFRINTLEEKAVLIMTLAILLLFFCFFCEEIHEKWQKYRRRLRKMNRTMKRLEDIKL